MSQLRVNNIATTAGVVNFTTSASGALTPNKPYFVAQAVLNDASYSSGTVLPYPNVVYNVGNAYNSLTSTFTAPVAGLYYFNFGVWHTSGTTRVGIRKNGVYITTGNQFQPIHARMGATSADQDSSLSMIIPLSTNDYVDVRSLEGTTVLFFGQHFMGYLIG